MLGYNIICLVFIFCCHGVYTLDSCTTRATCQDCIRDPGLCVWCAMNNFTERRCVSQNSYKPDWCPRYSQNPTNLVSATRNQNFSYDSKHVIQIKPQQYNMKLRPGKSEEFEFSFRAAPDYPVDLYFLLDASTTMKKIKETTAKQSKNIYDTIRKMTKNVYLGLGTFVDKPVLPFLLDFQTEKTYSFRHRLPLTDNFTLFKDMVSKSPYGVNLDPQEGGLDALAQVMVCKDVIGWRNESRKIIIFLTDAEYHAAGDGKAAGIFQPYDGKCYTYNESYTKEREMDYPSVGMINKLAVERNMIILFYVKSTVEYIYRSLSDVISGSRIASYSKNYKASTAEDKIVKTLKDIYEKISNKIRLKWNLRSGHRKNVEISFKPDCTREDSGQDCDVEIGKEKQFVGTVKLLEYDGQDNVIVDIVIEGLGEKLTLDIDVIKSCDCESNESVEEHSKFCNGEKRVCGICSCGDKRYGEKCACVKASGNNIINDNTTCILEGSDTICSGHGSCVCGSCVCRKGYSGTFCDCNHESCPRVRGELCSGVNNGDCRCGNCVCKPGWKGNACDCSSHDCKHGGQICSNRGNCVCGVCECDTIAKWDSRIQYDENCKMIPNPDRQNMQCRALETCALCLRKDGDDCMSCDNSIQTRVVQTLSEEYLNNTNWNVCPNIKVDIGCYTTLVYQYDDEKYEVKLVVQLDQNCAESYYMFGGIFLATLILVGIATLVAWKKLTDARDRKEYMQFVNKAKESDGKNINPLYQPPTTSFDNPGFRKQSFR